MTAGKRSECRHKASRDSGVGYCPEERGIFAGLSCEENLLLPPRLPVSNSTGMSLEEIYEIFPNLAERRASQGTRLSGGEQQMLAIARILRTEPTCCYSTKSRKDWRP